MRPLVSLAVFVIANVAWCADLELAALEILSAEPVGIDNCFIDNNGDGVRDGTTAGISMAEVHAITNRADVLALAAQLDADAQRPPEVDRVAYMTGWSESIDADGTPLRWRTHASPYDPAVDAANRETERLAAQADRLALRALKDAISTNINDVQAITGTTAQQLTALRRELTDSNQTQREIVRILRRMMKDDTP
jgi:hypothetical protein